ncbi:hypothetical protein [Chromatium okenii]|jgi:putative transcriptional regulator|uniref:Uncharacterized protein n=1 Tax=Chromatium okenii TaxID=61644 RepID=A0A2S7XR71_9GAMM|nr:hypothetical protein [Chromatium okenii]PQJ96146.1 hypothetical protein CXB77_10080 [Chromatium okenii]
MNKRNLFTEIVEGFEALVNMRNGQQTLRTHEMEITLSDMTANEPCQADCNRLSTQQPAHPTVR